MFYPLSSGQSYPLGVSVHKSWHNFAFFSQKNCRWLLLLYYPEESLPFLKVAMKNTKGVWHVSVANLPPSFEYLYQIHSQDAFHNSQDAFHKRNQGMLDPYAKDLTTPTLWNQLSKQTIHCCYHTPSSFDWEDDARPMIPMEQLIIYEMHVRGFTQDPSSQAIHPGTFLGIVEKIPYLVDLGINAVELMPIYEFYEWDYAPNPHLKDLCQYWGYSPINFFTPMRRYGTSYTLKTLVKSLHQVGIEVILDVVYNHTLEGQGKNFSFRGIDPLTYYLIDDQGQDLNYSGCGNTFNCNHPITQQLILDSLRHWVLEYHVDGFRFDLASVLTRDVDGKPISPSPLIEKIIADPILGTTKLIAEPWDAGGLYQVGSFPGWRFSEWNGKYQDSARKFLSGRGDQKEIRERLMGSHDLYHKHFPAKSINFITSHDGFSLRDLVSYQHKHNHDNYENNRDGRDENYSWNCGTEGVTNHSHIQRIRDRQMRNFLLMLLTSQGVPMLLMGDEYGHTKYGNNNTWCQDNRLNYFLWDQLRTNQSLHHYVKKLIRLRKSHPDFQSLQFLSKSEVVWYDLMDGQAFAYQLRKRILVAFNPTPFLTKWSLPSGRWQSLVDTYHSDSSCHSVIFKNQIYPLYPFSSVLLSGVPSSSSL